MLPAGLVTRGALWEASETPANPGLTRMTGEQLLELLERGNDPEFQAETPRPLRGRPRGRLELVGAAPEAGRDTSSRRPTGSSGSSAGTCRRTGSSRSSTSSR